MGHLPTVIEQLAEQRIARLRTHYSLLVPSEDVVRTAIVDFALAFVGVTEKGTTNSGYWVDRYLKDLGLDPGLPWCLAAVQWPIKAVSSLYGLPDLLSNNTAGTQRIFDWATTQGLVSSSIEDVAGGDVLIWRDGSAGTGHAGIVLLRDGRTIATAEGNTGLSNWRDGGLFAIKSYTLDPATFGVRQPGRWMRGVIQVSKLMQREWKALAPPYPVTMI